MGERWRHRRASIFDICELLPHPWRFFFCHGSEPEPSAPDNQRAGIAAVDGHCRWRLRDIRRRSAASELGGSSAGDGAHGHRHWRSCRCAQLVYGIRRAVERGAFRPLFGSGRVQSGGRRGSDQRRRFQRCSCRVRKRAGAVAAHHRDAYRALRGRGAAVPRDEQRPSRFARRAERDEPEHAGTRRSGLACQDRRYRDRHEPS